MLTQICLRHRHRIGDQGLIDGALGSDQMEKFANNETFIWLAAVHTASGPSHRGMFYIEMLSDMLSYEDRLSQGNSNESSAVRSSQRYANRGRGFQPRRSTPVSHGLSPPEPGWPCPPVVT